MNNILFLFILFSLILFSSSSLQRGDQREILIEFFKSTNGSGWRINENWLSENHVCNWYGVNCNSDAKVFAVILSTNYLSGTIPSSLGQMNALSQLYLTNNQLSGTIPSALGQSQSLVFLHLDNNKLTGAIPSSLGQINTLEWLQLNDNQLTGTIPSSLGNLNNLNGMYLENNQLNHFDQTSIFPPNLRQCDMSNNSLVCPIPDWTVTDCNAQCNN